MWINPVKCIPNMIIKIPPVILIKLLYLYMIFPSNDAEAPIRTKTKEKPKTYDTVDRNTFLLISVLQSVVNSSMEKPVIKVKYDGIIGSIQGEKKERSPAKKAAEYVIVSINIGATGLTLLSALQLPL